MASDIEFGCGCVYTGLSDEFAIHWQVQANSARAVRERGGAFVAYRQLLRCWTNPADFQPIGLWAAVMLDPTINSQYDQNLRVGDRPLFQEDIKLSPIWNGRRGIYR